MVRDCCPACGSRQYTTVYSRDFQDGQILDYLRSFYSAQGTIETDKLLGAKFVLDECRKCGLIYQREIPDLFLTKTLYEEWIDPKFAYAQHLRDSLQHHANHAREIMTITAYLNAEPHTLDFLDVGMGWGEWCLMAKAFGCNVYGIELSPSRMEHAKSIGVSVISWKDLPSYEFDFINNEQVFEHIPQPLETLRSLKESLRPNGLIKISVPNGRDLKRRLKVSDWKAPKGTMNSLNLVHPLEHINCFTRRSIVKMGQIIALEEVTIPITLQYVYSTMWKPVIPFLKNLARPIYYNLFGTYVFFRHRRNP